MEKELQLVNEILLQVYLNFFKSRFLKVPRVLGGWLGSSYLMCIYSVLLYGIPLKKTLFGGQKENSQNHTSVLNYQSIYYA